MPAPEVLRDLLDTYNEKHVPTWSVLVFQDLKRVLSFPPYPGDYLHPVVYACTAVMLLCVLVSIMTYIMHYSVIRISRNGWHILLNFLFHTAVTFSVFAGGINQIKYPFCCQMVGIVLHYASLSTMLWLTFTARNICKDVSKVPPPQDRDVPKQPKSKPTILRLYLVSDGVPLIIVGVTVAVSMENYGSRDDALYCWMAWEASVGSFYGPVTLLVLVMCIYFLWTFIQLKRHPERKYELKLMKEEQQCLATAETFHCHQAGPDPEETGGGHHSGCLPFAASVLANEHSFKAQLRATAFTLFLFLATWAMGALAVSQGHFLDMVFSCLYGAFSITLGLFLLIQHCAKRDDVWHRWWACCPSKQKAEVNGGRHAHGHNGHPQPSQGHCHANSPCSGKQLHSPHLLHTPATHYKMASSPLLLLPPALSPGQNHAGPCCVAVHGPSTPLLAESSQSPLLQSLHDKLPRPKLHLQSCLKDRTKSRSFNQQRPSLKDYHYHMASTSMDGSVHSSHLNSPLSVHLDGPLVCHSPHPDLQLPCPSPHLDKQLGCHTLRLDNSCHSVHDALSYHGEVGLSRHGSLHLEGQPSCHETHTCRRRCPTGHYPFSMAGQQQEEDPDMYSSTKTEDTMLHMEMEPPIQALPRPHTTLSRRGTISHNGSLQEDFLFGLDATGNVRTGPWKNETTV
ncbi:adhesion G protein-coupled receptor A1 [Coregonus clupeaformis]|uniref:adhesion G protein-coupled receptor A1 n=1 Tax=Coregonus clupeaformis TaxID=59861 RepID=UPI001BE02BFB|nr:adhesion G protein-coupled receptor A1 [Coregonus clupeaformis]